MGEAGVWPGAELRTPPAPKGSDFLGGNIPETIPKVAGSGGLPLAPGVPSPACFTPLEPGAGDGGREGGGQRRREERVQDQQQLYGWLCECEVKETSLLVPSSPLLCLTGSSQDGLN